MASTSPDLTQYFDLPSPVPSDPPDVPGDIKALAEKIDLILHQLDSPSMVGSVTAPAPWTGSVTYRRVGHVVMASISMTRTTPTTANSGMNLGTLPTGYHPSGAAVYGVLMTYHQDTPNVKTPVARLQIDTNGVMTVASRIEDATALMGSVGVRGCDADPRERNPHTHPA